MVLSKREGLVEIDKLIHPGSQLSEDAIFALKKQEHDYLIARVGLQGTLWGAWACLIVIGLIILSPWLINKTVVDGWQVVAIVAIMMGAVVFYGTFIFKRALTASGTFGKSVFTVATPVETEEKKEVAAKAAASKIQPPLPPMD